MSEHRKVERVMKRLDILEKQMKLHTLVIRLFVAFSKQVSRAEKDFVKKGGD